MVLDVAERAVESAELGGFLEVDVPLLPTVSGRAYYLARIGTVQRFWGTRQLRWVSAQRFLRADGIASDLERYEPHDGERILPAAHDLFRSEIDHGLVRILHYGTQRISRSGTSSSSYAA